MSERTVVTLDQQRASFAWQKTEESARFIGDYTVVAKSTASLIMNSGLMQTLAFLKSKDTQAHNALLNHLLKWLDIRFLTKNEESDVPDFAMVMNALHQVDSSQYMQVSKELMALLRWIRQFADARKSMEKSNESSST